MDMKVWMNVQLIGNRIYTAQLRSLSVFTYEFLFASRSCMPQRLDILQEYFSLVKDLNHTNKFKNEQTQIRFVVEGDIDRQLFAKLDKGKKYLMCEKVEIGRWRPSRFAKYENLALFLCREISNYESNRLVLKQTLTEYILQRLFSFG